MAIYNLHELLNCLESMANDGYEYVDISELEPEDGCEACLNIDAIVDKGESESEQIDSVKLSEDYHCQGM